MIRIPQSVTQAAGRALLQTKKNSPHIFFAAGVAGAVGSTVLACKATLKLEKALDEVKESIDKVKAAPNITEQERHRLLTLKYGRGAAKITRLYLPAGVVGGLAIACLTGSHVQLVRRNSALSGALLTMSTAWNNYRERVRGEVGEEKELDIFHGVTESTEIVDGKKKKVKSVGTNSLSPYTRIFDATSPHWEPNAELNWMYIRAIQKHFNDRLHVYGHVMLNEVFDELGFDRTRIGAQVGWLKSKNGSIEDQKVSRIDFGLGDEKNERFINGAEHNVWLTFNVDGPIYELI